MAQPLRTIPEKLERLESFIRNLPNTLPVQPIEQSKYAMLMNLTLPAELVEDKGEPGAFSHLMKDIFGWRADTSDGIITIEERGPALLGSVSVFREMTTKYAKNAVIEKWLDNILVGLEKVFSKSNIPLPTSGSSTPSSVDPNELKRKASHSEPEDSDSGSEVLETKKKVKKKKQGVTRTVTIRDEVELEEFSDKITGKGRVPNPIISQLAIRCKEKVTQASWWRCMGFKDFVKAEGPCNFKRIGNADQARILTHAKQCRHLPRNLKVIASDAAANSALGANVKKGGPVTSGNAVPKSASVLTPSSSQLKLTHDFTAQGKKEVADEINHRIMQLICCDGIPPHILDSPRWKNLMEYCCRNGPNRPYTPLKNERNLTVTFDGGSIRKPQSVYTTHITTEDRITYFWNGDEASDRSHDAEYVNEVIDKTVTAVGGPSKVVSLNSDNTGNVRKGRQDYTLVHSTVLNTRDSPHAFHNTIGEINKLSWIQPMISMAARVIKYSRKSNISSSALKKDAAESRELERSKGLISVGGTRFATHYSSLTSLEPHLRAIQRLVENGTIEIKANKTVKSFFTSRIANAADVYVFWLAIAATLKNLFLDEQAISKLGLTSECIQDIIRIVNKRYKDFIDDSPTDIYFSAFYLDPRFAHSNILKTPTTGSTTTGFTIRVPTASSTSNNGILHPKAFQHAKTFLKTVLQNEVDALSKYGDKALLHNLFQTRYHRKDELVEAFKSQLLAFGRNQFPFKSGCNQDTDPLKWWKHLTQDENADVLATINVKIFAVLPNSMPDERTVSEFTQQNSALRGNQSVSTLVDIVQVGQWYKVHSPRIAGGPVKPPRQPVVKFRDMTRELQNGEVTQCLSAEYEWDSSEVINNTAVTPYVPGGREYRREELSSSQVGAAVSPVTRSEPEDV
ncbi:ribonuclease H-like domain-containing protein [Lentinula lateritia]|uniref:Ribonuclease H-like domain-containing protein n=1 Tax=Lentinula lateritia TaxID=40482 RepID=A0ABQ8VUQ6_9AGAR|nr:ribonuclease H-like domain-containing protein [Lentinula lateritia]